MLIEVIKKEIDPYKYIQEAYTSHKSELKVYHRLKYETVKPLIKMQEKTFSSRAIKCP